MAFPAVQTADTENGTVTSNSSSWTITYPTNIASGDLLLAFFGADGNGANIPTATGWSPIMSASATAASVGVLGKIAAGTETGTFTATMAASEQGGWRVFRITGWFGSGLNSGLAVHDGTGIDFSDPVTGASQNPDPGACNPANWDVEDTLWIACCGVDTSRTISVYPLPDLNTADVSGGAGGATLGICMDDLAQASLDAGTFTISTSDDWAALTIAVRPAAAATPASLIYPPRPVTLSL